MENILWHKNLIPTIFYLAVALISFVMYNRSNSKYRTHTKRIQSLRSFMYLYKYIQLSTLIVCIASIWSNNSYLFELYQDLDFMVYCGIGLSGLAIAIFSLSRFSLGKNYSPCYDSYMPKNIKTTGIYSIIRHPIYTSNIMLMLGIFITTGSLIVIANTIVLLAYYFISAFNEERAISKKFPKYILYKKQTGMFLPHLFKKIG
ncbi:MAG: hypothetical protein CMG00_06875 [Candidatus Marinimicrobia bacterium]|nr:hypothetical protein [Candidatus Neomarinimicrobiota bacterium]